MSPHHRTMARIDWTFVLSHCRTIGRRDRLHFFGNETGLNRDELSAVRP